MAHFFLHPSDPLDHRNQMYEGDIRATLVDKYRHMWYAAKGPLLENRVILDPFLSTRSLDPRRGLTILVALKGAPLREIRRITAEFNRLEPGHYVYPASDLHVTFFDIVGATAHYVPDKDYHAYYARLLRHFFLFHRNLSVQFEGLTASRSTLMAQGFHNSCVQHLRDFIRHQAHAKKFALVERYPHQFLSSHSSIVRFQRPFRNPDRVVQFIEKNRFRSIGEMRIHQVELVVHDWFNQKQKKETVAIFRLD